MKPISNPRKTNSTLLIILRITANDSLKMDIGIVTLNYRDRCLGSRYSRKPSPMKLKARTVSAIAIPGNINACGAACRVDRSRASSIITPHEGAGGGTPSPKNDNEASDKTAPAIPRLA